MGSFEFHVSFPILDGLLVAYGYDPSMAIPANQDSDGDGVSDLEELRNGTNPHDATDRTALLFG